MKRILLSTIAAAALFTATAAFAAEVIGAIKAIDTEKHTLLLDNGETYMLPMKADLSKLKVGNMVKVIYTTNALQSVHARMRERSERMLRRLTRARQNRKDRESGCHRHPQTDFDAEQIKEAGVSLIRSMRANIHVLSYAN